MNWTTIAQTLVYVAGVSFVAIKFFQWYFENDKNKTDIKARADVELVATKAKEATELKKGDVELAKANLLAAQQVAEVLKNQQLFINELEDIKEDMQREKGNNKEKNEQLLKLINRIEEIVKEQTHNFTSFIMNRAK